MANLLNVLISRIKIKANDAVNIVRKANEFQMMKLVEDLKGVGMESERSERESQSPHGNDNPSKRRNKWINRSHKQKLEIKWPLKNNLSQAISASTL